MVGIMLTYRSTRARFVVAGLAFIGLAAAGYNAGPGRVSAWLAGHRTLPEETRNYVAIITGWTADEWASPSPPETYETTIPQGLPCTRLANLILAPPKLGCLTAPAPSCSLGAR